MEPSPRLTIARNSAPGIGLHYSTSVVAITAQTRFGPAVGSALVLQVEDRYWLLTARHVIAKARPSLVSPWSIEALREGRGQARLAVHNIELNDELWHLADDDDLAVASFPVDALPIEHLVSAISIDRVGIAGLGFVPEVTLTGRWGEAQDRNLIVTRRGILATMQRPEVNLEIGPGEYTPREVYLIDASIMPGMSGGAIFDGMNPPLVNGLISARQIAPSPPSIARLPDAARMAAEAMWEAVGATNTGMVYAVPAARIVPFVFQAHRAA